MKTALTVLQVAIVGLALGSGPAAASPVPRPILEERLEVEQSQRYAFPWPGTGQCETLTPGCFRVEATHNHALTIIYERFSLRDDRVIPQRFLTRQEITTAGSSEALFAIEQEPPRQLWVHAAYEPAEQDRGMIRFFQVPAFVTKRARIYRTMLLDLPARRLRDQSRVEAEEPVTLITSGPIEKTIPGAWVAEIRVNGQRPRFFLPSLMNLNLRRGRSEIATEIRWRDDVGRLCPWPLYEGRKMSLPAQTQLTIRTAGRTPVAISVSTFGLPQEVWDGARVIREVRPQPERIEERPLAKVLRFPPIDEVVLTIKPVLVVSDFSFPVLVCVESR